MRMAWIGTRFSWVVAAVLALGGPVLPLSAAGKDPALRQRVLALNDVTGLDPLEGKIRILVTDPAGTKKLLAEAKELVKDKEAPLAYTADFILARAGHELKDFDTAQLFYKESIRKAAKLGSIHNATLGLRGLIALYYENQKYDECADACREFLAIRGDESIDNQKIRIAELLIQAIAKQGKYDEALKFVDALAKNEKGEGWWALSLKAGVQREAGNSADAAKTYEQVLERVAKDKALTKEGRKLYTDRNRYILSNVYIDLGQVDKAAGMLKSLLDANPDNATYNNDLGYIWADHDMNLDEAEKLIRKAIDLDRKERKAETDLRPDEDRDNPAYLDSLGWVLYKKKQYEEAKKYLVEATKDKDAQDLEIYDHLGDVNKALGDKSGAVAAWKKAVQLAKPSKRDQAKKLEVEKKLKSVEVTQK
jgi:tetratricopeptide (TPR) repeat protein